MGIEQVSGLLLRHPDGVANLFIAVPVCSDISCDGAMVVPVQVQDAVELLGAPTSMALAMVCTDDLGVIACEQVFTKDIVAVVGR